MAIEHHIDPIDEVGGAWVVTIGESLQFTFLLRFHIFKDHLQFIGSVVSGFAL